MYFPIGVWNIIKNYLVNERKYNGYFSNYSNLYKYYYEYKRISLYI